MARSRRDRDKIDDAGRATLAPGQLAVPNVRLTKKIAEGGMGSVWEGEHLALHTTVAVKFVLAEFGDNEEAVTRFEREATAAARIKSPHVVQMLDHGITENDGVPYIIMELLEGEDLEARLLREPRLPLDLVAHVVSQAAKALVRAHGLGIVHRDIKPSNVFLTDVGGETFVKLLDFGIARLSAADVGRARVTQTGAMLGTPIFMSPEQMTHAKDVGPGADIWSLGVVAYLAITGRLPFDEETIAGIAMAIERGEYPTPTEIMPQLPAELDGWFARIFQKDPTKRFASAKDMADALSRIAQVPPSPASLAHTSTPPPPPPEAEPASTGLLEAVEDEPTHVEDKGQVAARVAAAAAAAAGVKLDEGADPEARAKTLARKSTASRPPVAPSAEAADDADTPSEDIEITTSGLDGAAPDEPDDAARAARLPAPVMAKTSAKSGEGSKGPTTMMGVSGASAVAAPASRSRGALYAGVILALAAALAIAYFAIGSSGGPSPAASQQAPSAAASPSATQPTATGPAATSEASASPSPESSASATPQAALSASSAPSASAAPTTKQSASTPAPRPPAAPTHAVVAPPAPASSAAPATTSAPKAIDTAAPKPAEPSKAPAPAASH